MTATTRPPRRATRSSWMESLGFIDANHTWSDYRYSEPGPVTVHPSPEPPPMRRGRHEAAPPEPDPFDGWAPQPVVRRLERGNIRWAMVLVITFLLAASSAGAYWLTYEKPRVERTLALTAVSASAAELRTALDDLDAATAGEASRAAGIEAAARRLFADSAALTDEAAMRATAIAASNATLDAVRLINEADAYRNASAGLLAPPALQTDPELIALDEAARSFGEWQARFDLGVDVLSSSTFVGIDRRLDTLAARLSVALNDYVDALREDDMSAAQGVVDRIAAELGDISLDLDEEIALVEAQVGELVATARAALAGLLD